MPTSPKKPASTKSKQKSPLKKKTGAALSKKTDSSRKTSDTKQSVTKTQSSHSTSSEGYFPNEAFKPYKAKKGEPYMCDSQREYFKSFLLSQKDQLMQEAERTVSHLQSETTNFPDLIDQAAYQEKFTLELRTRDRERKLISKINDALERIARHDYGYCDECGTEIGISRLVVRPTAVLCIDCKTFNEIKERQTSAD